MLRLLTSVLAVLAFLTLGTAGFAQGAYKIQPGDVLQLEVLEDSTLNRNLLVLPDGSINVPSGGMIHAAGQTVAQVQAAVVQILAPGFAKPPTVNLAVGQLAQRQTGSTAAHAGIAVYAMGEVAKPGMIEIGSDTTLLQALAQSGGFTNFAATKRIQLHRTDASGHEQVILFNYDKAISGGAAIYLQKGDVIVVPQRRLFE